MEIFLKVTDPDKAALILEMGASAEAVLFAATRNGANVCGLEDRAGTLEPGKLDDIIEVKGNPLEDIRALGQIRTVIQAERCIHTASGDDFYR